MELMQILDFCTDTKEIWALIGKIIKIVLIVIPIIIVLLGTLDLGKAVMAGDDKEIKEAQKMFIKRLIYGAVILFVPIIVSTIYNLVDNGETTGSNVCWQCAVKGKC